MKMIQKINAENDNKIISFRIICKFIRKNNL